jgi:hypothetical protein
MRRHDEVVWLKDDNRKARETARVTVEQPPFGSFDVYLEDEIDVPSRAAMPPWNTSTLDCLAFWHRIRTFVSSNSMAMLWVFG